MPFAKSRLGLRQGPLVTLLLCLAFGSTIVAGVPPAATRIHSYINDFDRFTLRGNTRPAVAKALARAEGRLSSSFMLPRIVLHFARTPAQQADLEQLLRDQQDRRSPQYHRFLTPEQYAARFGLGDTDIATILNWLREEGFWNAEVARSKTWVSFSGTAAQAESAFHITLRHYKLNGETYYANASDPQLPKALQGVVGGVGGVHNFGMKPFNRRARPNFTFSDGITHHLAPDDWGTIYNVKPLWGQGIDGTGVKIAVVGQSDVQLSDLQAFRAAAGLSPKDPAIIVPPGMQDPGIQKSNGDEVESDLDLEWAGAIAPNADILFITASASTGHGVEDALTYAIDNNVAPIISISYGTCEPDEATSDFQTMNSLFQQANAEGITLVAASGDTGPAACDTAPNQPSATHGYAVSFPASSAYVTGVGGTTFQDQGSNWATTNDSASGSALGYSTEAVWDDGFDVLSGGASGGGASVLVSKPAWQTGTGVPSDNARDVPDLAFSASPSHDGYLICSEGSCRNGFVDNNNNVFAIGGTSAPTPAFAGVLALVIQEHGAGGSLGNINPNLYSLAQFSTNVFHDVTIGDNAVPCSSSPTTACPSVFQLFGFQAGPGYDRATGWGSLDATQFAEQWYGDFQIAVSPASLTLQKGSSGSANITLTPQNNFNGPVTFSCSVPSSLADVSCSIPDTVLNGSGTTTITINAAGTARTLWWKNLRLHFPSGSSGILTAALLLVGLAATIALFGPQRFRPVPSIPLTGLVAAAFAIAVISCGGSSSPSSSGSGTGSGTPPPSAPQLTLSCGLPSTVTTDVSVTYQCSASGGTGTLRFNVISGTLPPGIALNPYTGIIAGVTAKAGTYSFTVQVTDSGTPQQRASYAVTNFEIDSGLKPLTLTCNLPGGALTGVRYSGSCSAAGGASGYTYSISAGSLPNGLTMPLYGVIAGVPTSAGTSSFTVQVTDSSSSIATQTISNFIVGIGPLTSPSCSFYVAYLRAEYHGACSPQGGQPPFTYAITAGALPEGLTLDSSTGVVSGVPLVMTNGIAPSFTITVIDSSVPAQTASQSLSVYVFDSPPLVVNCAASSQSSLGVSFSSWCSIAGGAHPYTVNIISGQLPPGLQLDSNTGIISGTPTAMGTYPVTMQVVDSSVPPFSAQVSNVITVGPRPSETGIVTITAKSGGIVSTATLQVTVP